MNIRNLTYIELAAYIQSIGEKNYRTKQIWEALYPKKAERFELIPNIPNELRQKFSSDFSINSISAEKLQRSSDGTIKILFKLLSGDYIESVVIFDGTDGKTRITNCISTQVGCPVKCKFCATGKIQYKRNLEAAEIIEQFFISEKIAGKPLTNIVLMGMGEPLLNFDNVCKAMGNLTLGNDKVINNKKVTLSTVGIVPEIYRLADSGLNLKLSLSLHATVDETRKLLIPFANKWDLKELLAAVVYYYQKTKIPITYEYLLLNEINDSPEDAKRLTKISRNVQSKVNIIPFNNIFNFCTENQNEKLILKPCTEERQGAFLNVLRQNKVNYFVRNSTGADISAACGQLALIN